MDGEEAAERPARAQHSDDSDAVPWQRWIQLAQVLAPTTLAAALAFYFGYVSQAAFYDYFGLDIDSLGLSTTAVILRSAAVVYVPALALLLIALAGYLGYRALGPSIGDAFRQRPWLFAELTCLGVALAARGLYGILEPSVARTEFIAVTPTSLALGMALIVLGLSPAAPPQGEPAAASSRKWELVLLVGVWIVCLFWVANSFAAAYGRGRAVVVADDLGSRPQILLDVAEPLHLGEVERYPRPPSEPIAWVEHLCDAPTAERPTCDFPYRYHGLVLLAQSGDRLFMVPRDWTFEGPVIVIDMNDEARIQFQ